MALPQETAYQAYTPEQTKNRETWRMPYDLGQSNTMPDYRQRNMGGALTNSSMTKKCSEQQSEWPKELQTPPSFTWEVRSGFLTHPWYILGDFRDEACDGTATTCNQEGVSYLEEPDQTPSWQVQKNWGKPWHLAWKTALIR